MKSRENVVDRSVEVKIHDCDHKRCSGGLTVREGGGWRERVERGVWGQGGGGGMWWFRGDQEVSLADVCLAGGSS